VFRAPSAVIPTKYPRWASLSIRAQPADREATGGITHMSRLIGFLGRVSEAVQ
jgi:hypothetical protein